MNKMNEKVIKLKMTIEIPIDEIGETLISDDSESYALIGYGYDIQQKLREILGWNRKISVKLEKEAIEEINDEVARKIRKEYSEEDNYYIRWISKAQKWAEETINELKSVDFL